MQRRDLVLAGVWAGMFLAVTAGLATGGFLIDLDLAVYEWSEQHRSATTEQLGRILNRLAQGGVLLGLSLALAGLLWWRRRRRGRPRPLAGLAYVVLAAVLVVPTVLLIKYPLTQRAAPSSQLPPEQTVPLFGDLPPGEYAAGYPGGHALNTIVWYGVMLALVTALLHEYGRAAWPVPVRLAVRIVPAVIVLVVSTFLSFHWLTDGLAGLAFGLLVDRLLTPSRRRVIVVTNDHACLRVRSNS